MVSSIHIFLIMHLLLIQGYMNENIYCKEAVESVEKVSSCPTSKEQWDKAASRKKFRDKALEQTCSAPEKFVYHCVINGYGNATLEVCAPERLILGHCTEFNEVGGVIQDQLLSPCSTKFPRCDDYYFSSQAYKYEDCYKIVEAKKLISSTSKNVEHVPSDETVDGDKTSILVLSVGISASGIVVLVIVIVFAKRRKINRWRREEDVSGEIIFLEGHNGFGKRTEAEENMSEERFLFGRTYGEEDVSGEIIFLEGHNGFGKRTEGRRQRIRIQEEDKLLPNDIAIEQNKQHKASSQSITQRFAKR